MPVHAVISSCACMSVKPFLDKVLRSALSLPRFPRGVPPVTLLARAACVACVQRALRHASTQYRLITTHPVSVMIPINGHCS